MATISSKHSSGYRSTPSGDCAGDAIVQRLELDVVAANLALNNILDMGILPAGHVVTDMVLVTDDLDTNGSPAVTLDVGLVTGTPGDTVSARTIGNEFFSGATTAQAGGTARMSLATGFRVTSSTSDRSIGIKIATAPATAAATGKIGLIVTMSQAVWN